MDEHRKKQEDFWQALVKKYEERNQLLQQQQLAGRKSSKGPTASTNSESNCSCDPCSAKRSTTESDGNSIFSLGSADLQYMLQLKELVEREKEMKQMLNTPVFKDCTCDETFFDYRRDLLEENKRLTDELQDLKFEMNQCIEKVKGPITRQIEKEKYKNKRLEEELLKTTRNAALLQQTLSSETEDLRTELDNALKNIAAVVAVNEGLEEEIRSQKEKYDQLEEALINEKLAEAEMLKKLKAPPQPPCPCAKRSTPPRRSTEQRPSIQKPPLQKEPESKNFKSCKCQTDPKKDSAEVQAEPAMANAAADATVTAVEGGTDAGEVQAAPEAPAAEEEAEAAPEAEEPAAEGEEEG